jgi:hypothetical protein
MNRDRWLLRRALGYVWIPVGMLFCTVMFMLVVPQSLDDLHAEQLRELVTSLIGTVASNQTHIECSQVEIRHKQALIDRWVNLSRHSTCN